MDARVGAVVLALALGCTHARHAVPPVPPAAVYDDGHARVEPARPGDVPPTSLGAARARFDASTEGGSGIPDFVLGRVTFRDGGRLVAPWDGRLAWYAILPGGGNYCPRPGETAAGTVYAVDATGAGDGVVYSGPTRLCSGGVATAEARPLARSWSARWRLVTRTRTIARLRVRSLRCPGIALDHGGVPVEGAEGSPPEWHWAELYAVPYGATGCADGPEEPDVVERYYGRDGLWTVPRLLHARLGWVRLRTGVLEPL